MRHQRDPRVPIKLDCSLTTNRNINTLPRTRPACLTKSIVMMRGALTGLVLVCFVALLVEYAEAHIAFFSPKEMRELREKEGRKDVDPRAAGGLIDEMTPEEDVGESEDQHVEIGLKLTVKKGHVESVLGKMMQNILESKTVK
ncbi:motilin-like [Myxocyprinus asiaticus]|uniref:motilin-like n=1 Tax=Myxocyprinus asiaticus TaxID=70543 RepID=UPI002221DD56|nr:motilin-like [Myxocyprinus asiaticus]